MSRAENINPAILTWARETAGLDLDEAAERIGLSDTKTETGAEKLAAFERDDVRPTRVQLLKMAAVYRRPLVAFYMDEHPVAAKRGEDFRTLPGLVSKRDNGSLDALLRDVRARQDMVRSILEDDDDRPALDFVASVTIRNPITTVVMAIRNRLGLANIMATSAYVSADALFDDLRTRTEALGVFVLLIGNLGSHHSVIGEDVFRGFAIADPVAPFIIINDQDARSARAFTLIHELAHIFLGATGVSSSPTSEVPTTSLGRIERFCNDVAGELLLPTSVIPAAEEIDDGTEQDVIRNLAARWNVSEPMVAYRLHRTGRISDQLYSELCALYAARWRSQRAADREVNRDSDGGPSYYVIRKHRLGKALVGLVMRTVRNDAISHTKAAKVLGVKPASVEPLFRSFEPALPRRRAGR